MKENYISQRAFTLVELAIVLVIVGLIIGGVLQGRALIQNYELQRWLSDIRGVMTAKHTFAAKYHAVPGDFNRAEAFFGVNAAGCPNGNSTIGTCNGDGDHIISWDDWNNPSEAWREWQHLGLAELLKNNFTGTTFGVPPYAEANVNAPSIGTKGSYIIYQEVSPDPEAFNRCCDAYYISGIDFTHSLTPDEAYYIDQKMDNGLPATGRISTMTGSWSPDCTTSMDPATSQYNRTFNEKACNLYFWIPN